MGETRFEIMKASVDLTGTPGGNRIIVAQGASSGVEYIITVNSENEHPLHYSSHPQMSEEDILSTLVFGKPFRDLASTEQEQVSRWGEGIDRLEGGT